MKNVLVVDDEPQVRRMLAAGLAFAGYEVTAVGSGEEALEEMDRHPFALMMLDLVLPGMSGLEVCRQLRARGAHLPVVMVTSRAQEADRIAGLDAGADDYVGKPFSLHELLARVRAQVRRDDWRAGEGAAVALGDIQVDLRHRLVRRRGRRVSLAAREFELLRYLLAHRNEVVSREQLLRDVWGYSELSVSRTVDNYVAKLRTHLEPRPHRPRFIVTVHGSGYQLLA